MPRHPNDGWCVLRCSGRSTLRLAQSLGEDGLDVWTPAKTVTIRRSRWNVGRPVTLPVLAGFVFAKAEHLVDLLELSNRPERPRRGRLPAHDGFSVFHHCDRIPIIDEAELEALRRLERKLAIPERARLAKPYARGALVRVGDEAPAWEGKIGVVECSKAGETQVRFDGRYVVKINTFILQPISAYSGSDRKAA